jgi:hypothetical protein
MRFGLTPAETNIIVELKSDRVISSDRRKRHKQKFYSKP